MRRAAGRIRIPVFYNHAAAGYYRVLLAGAVPPVPGEPPLQRSSLKYGLIAMTIAGLMVGVRTQDSLGALLDPVA